ncbi:MAG TPA: flagellar motor protein MotB [Bryobacteraceae bacterium]|jgi:chemotaxis protein MotB|nr:flagellar motor protein MotB [Bryobacteraceae bacterium]
MAIRKRASGDHSSHERWLVSYADFITLLFAFFVVMFASSQADKAKAKQVSDSVKKAFDKNEVSALVENILGGAMDQKGKGNAMHRGPGGAKQASGTEVNKVNTAQIAALLPSLEALTRELAPEIRAGKIEISLQPRGLVISFQQAALFPSGEAVIAEASVPSVGKVAAAIHRLPNPVRLEGHTDSVPIHNSRFRSNWDLSAARSIALLELMVNRFSIPNERLSIAGYADNDPAADNSTEQGRARNRRVDVVILSASGIQGEPKRAPATQVALPAKSR